MFPPVECCSECMDVLSQKVCDGGVGFTFTFLLVCKTLKQSSVTTTALVQNLKTKFSDL